MIVFAMLLWPMQFERPDGTVGLDTHTLVHFGVMACVFAGFVYSSSDSEFGPTRQRSRPVPFECKTVSLFVHAEALLKEALGSLGRARTRA